MKTDIILLWSFYDFLPEEGHSRKYFPSKWIKLLSPSRRRNFCKQAKNCYMKLLETHSKNVNWILKMLWTATYTKTFESMLWLSFALWSIFLLRQYLCQTEFARLNSLLFNGAIKWIYYVQIPHDDAAQVASSTDCGFLSTSLRAFMSLHSGKHLMSGVKAKLMPRDYSTF